MNFIADLHIHSPYSRATSKKSNLAGLFAWARVKGIHLIGTGDFTHPGWIRELRENLVPAEPGLFRLKNKNVPPALAPVRPEDIDVRFILTAEISSIYKRHDRVRKVHNLLFAPDFASVEKMNATLAGIGNIESDGRPILGLDSRDLLEIQLTDIPDGFLVPAHIWTPWFSLFGSKSGFDAIEECYGDLTKHIFALETGLSSDPDMNRLISALDRFTLISNSDCHSPGKLGREVNLFDCDMDFYSMKKALQDPAMGLTGTVEFFPEEGKYHLDGHRKCEVSLEPNETRQYGGICPVCGKPLTVGVSHRVMDLADRDTPHYPQGAPTFQSLIPLQEVIGEIMGRGPATKGVLDQYGKAINTFGSEFTLLLHTPIEDLQKLSPLLAEAVKRIREKKVIRQAGFDGRFGVIHVFEQGEIDRLSGRARLFDDMRPLTKKKISKKTSVKQPSHFQQQETPAQKQYTTNTRQQEAITSTEKRIIVSAGPGTGKTFTLVSRILHLLEKRKISGRNIAAITFTNRAANEMKERLAVKAGQKAEGLFVGTFHAFCLDMLQEEGLIVIGEGEREVLLKKLFTEKSARQIRRLSRDLSDYFLSSSNKPDWQDEEIALYLNEVANSKAIDLEAIIPHCNDRLAAEPQLASHVRKQIQFLFVDEFQDVNRSQFDLVSFFAQSAEIFAIGDSNQAIYGFRGSDLQFFVNFAASPETQALSLEANYRSAPVLLQAADAVISHNRTGNTVSLVPQRVEKGDITFFSARTAKEEAEYVVKTIEKIMGGISSFSINSGRSGGEETGYGFGDIAVCYRLSRHAASLAEALERRGIPFQLVGGRPFFMENDVRGPSLFLLSAAGMAGFAEHFALCREMPGIGNKTLVFLEKNIPINTRDFLKDALLCLPKRAEEILQNLRETLHRFTEEDVQLADRLLPVFKLFNAEPDSDNGRRLLKLAGAFGSLTSLAGHLHANMQATIYDERAEAVSLMTLHGAKGLEFPVVFLCGLDKSVMPCSTPGCDEEEERRLFYVGMTRAEDKLFLSSSGPEPSHFIREIPSHLLSKADEAKTKRKKPAAKQLKLF